MSKIIKESTTVGKGITKATTDLMKVVKVIEGFGETKEELIESIVAKESELAQITENVTVETKKAKKDLSDAIYLNEEKVLVDLAKTHGFDLITKGQHSTVVDKLVTIEAEQEEELEKVREEAKTTTAKAIAKAVKNADNVNDLANAEIKAELRFAKEKIATLEKSVQDAKNEIKAEREARIKIAENSGVVVNTTGK